MAFHLISRARQIKIRDGRGGEMKDVGPKHPVLFENLDIRDFMYDADVIICELQGFVDAVANGDIPMETLAELLPTSEETSEGDA